MTATATDYPPEFITYAKNKMATDAEFIRHEARFGTFLRKNFSVLIIVAAGEELDP